jgi:hypothetical protein
MTGRVSGSQSGIGALASIEDVVGSQAADEICGNRFAAIEFEVDFIGMPTAGHPRQAAQPTSERDGASCLAYGLRSKYRSRRLFVRFSDDRRVVVRFDVAVFVLGIIIIIIVVGVSRRHHADEAPVGEPGGNVLGRAWGHVGSCRMSRHSSTHV